MSKVALAVLAGLCILLVPVMTVLGHAESNENTAPAPVKDLDKEKHSDRIDTDDSQHIDSDDHLDTDGADIHDSDDIKNTQHKDTDDIKETNNKDSATATSSDITSTSNKDSATSSDITSNKEPTINNGNVAVVDPNTPIVTNVQDSSVITGIENRLTNIENRLTALEKNRLTVNGNSVIGSLKIIPGYPTVASVINRVRQENY